MPFDTAKPHHATVVAYERGTNNVIINTDFELLCAPPAPCLLITNYTRGSQATLQRGTVSGPGGTP